MALKLGMTMAAAVLLAGCGSSGSGQSKAFVTFLQTRILDKPGLHVPQLTDDERSSLGPYVDQYAIISNFNKTLSESVSPRLASAMRGGSITSIEDLVTRKAQLAAAKTTIDTISGALAGDLANADAAHGKLDQPAEVKVVYDQAYNRLVTQPAAAFKGIVPVMDTVLGQAIDLGNYIDAHRAVVRISGSTVETSDPAVRATINAKLQSLQASQQTVLSAQTKMQAIVYGGAS